MSEIVKFVASLAKLCDLLRALKLARTFSHFAVKGLKILFSNHAQHCVPKPGPSVLATLLQTYQWIPVVLVRTRVQVLVQLLYSYSSSPKFPSRKGGQKTQPLRPLLRQKQNFPVPLKAQRHRILHRPFIQVFTVPVFEIGRPSIPPSAQVNRFPPPRQPALRPGCQS